MSKGLRPIQFRENAAATFLASGPHSGAWCHLPILGTLQSTFLFFKTPGFVNTKFKGLFPKHSQFNVYLERDT